MSKNRVSFPLVLIAFLQILQFVNNSCAQEINATIMIEPQSSIVSVVGRNTVKSRNLSFLLSMAGQDRLGDRISEVSLYDEKGQTITYKRFIPGEFVADRDFSSWKYKADLMPTNNQSALAHVSWVGSRNGILMLGDLLPQFALKDGVVSAEVNLDLPEKWRAFSEKRRTSGNVFGYSDVEKAVIFIGTDLLPIPIARPGGLFYLVVDGSWNFTYFEATASVREIYDQYTKSFYSYPDGDGCIAVLRFPITTQPGVWEAETRGNNITILSSDTPFKSQSIQRLHEQLRHEIFHLWIPNGVNLSGNYDWFYEGFALYQSLKLGVAVNRITFDDYLDTLSRAYDIERHDGHKLSMIDASKERWNGANTQVYARGMLVAFLCDLALLQRSKGKTSVTDLVRELYLRHRPPAATEDGNAAVLSLMRSHPELIPIIDRNISGTASIDWASLLQAAGLEADGDGRLRVSAHLSGSQKDLLDKLGYNNWRKLPRSKK